MKTILFLILIHSNGTEQQFPVAEFYHGLEVCKAAAPAMEQAFREHPTGQAVATLFEARGTAIAYECRRQ